MGSWSRRREALTPANDKRGRESDCPESNHIDRSHEGQQALEVLLWEMWPDSYRQTPFWETKAVLSGTSGPQRISTVSGGGFQNRSRSPTTGQIRIRRTIGLGSHCIRPIGIIKPDRPSALRREAPHSVPISSSRTLSPSPVSA